jgi:hypothetical protein
MRRDRRIGCPFLKRPEVSLSVREPTQMPQDFLLSSLRRAREEVAGFSPASGLTYDGRIAQVERGVVESSDFRAWLLLHLDYWSQKDREYGAYLQALLDASDPSFAKGAP